MGEWWLYFSDGCGAIRIALKVCERRLLAGGRLVCTFLGVGGVGGVISEGMVTAVHFIRTREIA